MYETSIIIGVAYLSVCFFLCKYNKVKYCKYGIEYLNLNKKFMDPNNIYDWVHHQNNTINVNLSTITHFLTVTLHSNLYLYLVINNIYYHE